MNELVKEFTKIGLLTFGGGSAATPIIHERLVKEKNWINEDEFIDIVAMANVLPGPSMVQMASLIGLKREQKLGAIVSAFAICAPSVIIFVLVMAMLAKYVDPVQVSKITSPLFILIGISMFLTSKQIFDNNKAHGVGKNIILTLATFIAIIYFDIPAVIIIVIVIIGSLIKGGLCK